MSYEHIILQNGPKRSKGNTPEFDFSMKKNSLERFDASFASYAATPVATKHDIATQDDERFLLSAMMKLYNHQDCVVQFPDARCVQSDRITLRAPSDDEDAITCSGKLMM